MKFLLLIVTIINLLIFSSDIITVFDNYTDSQQHKKISNIIFKFFSVIVLYTFAYAFLIVFKAILSFIFDNQIMNETGYSLQNILDTNLPMLIEKNYIWAFATIDICLFILLCMRKNKDKWEMLCYFLVDIFIVGIIAHVIIFRFVPNNEGQIAISLFLLQLFYLIIGWYFAVKSTN